MSPHLPGLQLQSPLLSGDLEGVRVVFVAGLMDAHAVHADPAADGEALPHQAEPRVAAQQEVVELRTDVSAQPFSKTPLH